MGLPRRYPLARKRGVRRAAVVVNLAGRRPGDASPDVYVSLFLSSAAPNVLSGVGASTGTSTADATGATVAAGAGAAAGTSTIAGTGAATFAGAGAAAGASTAAAVGSTATTVVAGAGASAGTSTAAASGSSTAASAGASAGIATAAAVGASTAAAGASAAASSTASAVGVAVVVVEAVGASAGTSTADAGGGFVAVLSAVGASAGTSTVSAFGIGLGTVPIVGAASSVTPAYAVASAVSPRPDALVTRQQLWDYVGQAQPLPLRLVVLGSAVFGAPQVVGSFYLAGGATVGLASQARLGASGALSVRLDVVPAAGGAALASFALALPSASFGTVSLASSVYLPAGWYDMELHALSAGTAYSRGLHLAA